MGNTGTKASEAVPLTSDKFVKVMMHVKIESKRFLRRRMIREILRISDFKSNEIIRGCRSDEERLEKLAEFWLAMCPYASWRWLIWFLDLYEHHDIVDQICQFAEPLNAPSLTVSNVSKVLDPLSTYMFNMCLGVSEGGMVGVRKRIWSQSENEERYREGLISWWLSTSPFATWEFLAEALHSLKGQALMTGYQLAMKHIKHTQDPTLTEDNLNSLLDVLPDHAYAKNHKGEKWSYRMGSFKPHLTPDVDAFMEYKALFVSQYLTDHPAPSWKLLAHAVYCRCEYGVLETIHRKYLNSTSDIVGARDSHSNSVDLVSDDKMETPSSPSVSETATEDARNIVSVTKELSTNKIVDFLLQHVKVTKLDTRIWKRPRFIGVKVFHLSSTAVDIILSTCTYDEREQVEKLVNFWLLRCPLASWRWLIWRLVDCNHSQAAKVIQQYAETISDPTLTVDGVAALFKDQRTDYVRECLIVPFGVRYGDRVVKMSEEERKVELIQWWLAYSPFAAWDLLAVQLENMPKMETVRACLPKAAPPSMSLQNLSVIFKDSQDSDVFHSVLQTLLVPNKTTDYLFQDKAQRDPHLTSKQAILQFFFDAYGSSLSWRLIAYKIYLYEKTNGQRENVTSSDSCTYKNNYKMIKRIQRSFLKGPNLQDLCVQVVGNSMTTLEDVELLPLPRKIKVLVELSIIS